MNVKALPSKRKMATAVFVQKREIDTIQRELVELRLRVARLLFALMIVDPMNNALKAPENKKDVSRLDALRSRCLFYTIAFWAILSTTAVFTIAVLVKGGWM